ncbi:hypothetical protein J1G18_24795 [Pseudomonas sp. MIS38]|uniref:hypothetical protein n=1 Tax=Pseudomonas sp. MIS38 TaxID=91465 RepID=UPI001CA77ECC|nr:hypothetical protein [Pseudomonas sp. MIS38]MBY8960522.1 hypothetical protein [Pseudomonas sp. MIS38]
MITEDIKIVEEIFQEVEVGIVDGYDAFRYGVELGEGYIETELAVEKDGVEDWNAETDINGAKILRLVDQLQAAAASRGEP